MHGLAAGKGASRTRRWAITIAATAISAYALDAFATVTGVLLAASGVLAGAPQAVLLGVLVASYALWGVGLRVSLAANWALLEQTGTSTNALSKAAYDVVGTRTARTRPRRLAASTGYVGTELAKEVPYYAGAFGAALTDTVTSSDAVIFLAGANVGAAGYEYVLGRATRLFLRRR